MHQGFWGIVLTTPMMIYQWKTPSLDTLFLALFAGLFFAVALFLFLDAFYYTESHIIAVLSYSLTVFVAILNWIINRETLSVNSLIGSVLIVCGGIFVIFDQYRIDLEKTKTDHYNTD